MSPTDATPLIKMMPPGSGLELCDKDGDHTDDDSAHIQKVPLIMSSQMLVYYTMYKRVHMA